MKSPNLGLQNLITDLKKLSASQENALWKRVANDLEKSSRNRRIVNISRIDQHTKEDEIIVVPGKVLGSGFLSHKITVAAFGFSDSARNEIVRAKGRALSIQELMKDDPKGKRIRIIG